VSARFASRLKFQLPISGERVNAQCALEDRVILLHAQK
jgi:hypothetical protein